MEKYSYVENLAICRDVKYLLSKKNGRISLILLVDYGDAARFELHALYTQNNGLYVKYAYLYFILDQYICISK